MDSRGLGPPLTPGLNMILVEAGAGSMLYGLGREYVAGLASDAVCHGHRWMIRHRNLRGLGRHFERTAGPEGRRGSWRLGRSSRHNRMGTILYALVSTAGAALPLSPPSGGQTVAGPAAARKPEPLAWHRAGLLPGPIP